MEIEIPFDVSKKNLSTGKELFISHKAALKIILPLPSSQGEVKAC